MLIITADDFGKTKLATERILDCFKNGKITSASAMMFMADSERAANLVNQNDLDIGLHTNFSTSFDGTGRCDLKSDLEKTKRFLKASKYSVLFYHPFLRRCFRDLFEAQYMEYCRLYGRPPRHINGHQHYHLCANVIFDSIIPAGTRIRRNFTYARGEKDLFNRLYRRLTDNWIMRKYEVTDYFFDIYPINTGRIERIVSCAKDATVELMVHPERAGEYSYLMGNEYNTAISKVRTGGYPSSTRNRGGMGRLSVNG